MPNSNGRKAEVASRPFHRRVCYLAAARGRYGGYFGNDFAALSTKIFSFVGVSADHTSGPIR
ncbi:MAG: hypothetical protein UZ07_CHB004002490 [Chlorobi bacterium OLB7]|nr:MAG: hypothetical protein UZ07_CHB004002490 [Chlorobi bacterium OLB7]